MPVKVLPGVPPGDVWVDPALHEEVSRIYQALRDTLVANPAGSLRAAAVLVALEALTVAVLRAAVDEDRAAGTVLALAQVESLADMVQIVLAEGRLETTRTTGQVH